jgi:hypothetical protein
MRKQQELVKYRDDDEVLIEENGPNALLNNSQESPFLRKNNKKGEMLDTSWKKQNVATNEN